MLESTRAEAVLGNESKELDLIWQSPRSRLDDIGENYEPLEVRTFLGVPKYMSRAIW